MKSQRAYATTLDELLALRSENARLRAENTRYRAALEWYANEPNAIDDDNRAWNALHPQESK